MNTDHAKKEKERHLCQRVAEEMNQHEGLDYCAQNSEHDPPDCLMKSRSGKFETREVEVTTASGESTMREDRDSLSKACKAFEAELRNRGVSGYHIQLDLTDKGLRSGVKQESVRELANVFCAEIKHGTDQSLYLGGTQIWRYSPKLGDLVGGVSGDPLAKSDTVTVVPCMSAYESDGSCIAKAIAAKSENKYAPRDAARYDLVIGCAWHIGKAEVQSYLHAELSAKSAYRSIWLTTAFDGVFRVK